MEEIELLQLLTVLVELITAFVTLKIMISEFQTLKREATRSRCRFSSLVNTDKDQSGEKDE